MSLTKVTYSLIKGAPKNVFDYMTDAQIADVQSNSATVDVTAAIQAAITDSVDGGVILFPSGTYLITDTITKPAGVYGPSLIGEGFNTTKFYYPSLSASAKPCLKYVGGSGGLRDIVIYGITFEGDVETPIISGSTAILIDGQNGVLISKCQFVTNFFGIQYANLSSGNFTEYCVADDCNFEASCSVPIRYIRTSGDASFHGSGFRNCRFVKNTDVSNNPVVVVENNCFPYNAPASGHVWISGASNGIFIENKNSGTLKCNWFGTLTIESFGPDLVLGASPSGAPISYVGSIISLNEYYAYGTLKTYFDYYVTAASSQRGSRKPYQVEATATTGTTTIPLQCEPTNAIMVSVKIEGADYLYSHVLTIIPGKDVGAAAYIVEQLDGQAFNTAGWGISTFGVGGALASPALTVTNATAGFDTVVTLGITQIGFEKS